MNNKDEPVWIKKGFPSSQEYHGWLDFNSLVHSNFSLEVVEPYEEKTKQEENI